MARQGGSGGFGVAATLKPVPFTGGVGVGAILGPESLLHSPTPDPASGRSAPQPDLNRAARGLPDAPEGEGLIDIGTGTQPSAPERRIVRINGATAAATALAEWLTVLWLTPAMDRLFVEPAGERRRFLDRLTLALRPDHAQHANRYEAAMRARNRLLADDLPDPQWLTALEAQMVEEGGEMKGSGVRVAHRLLHHHAATPPRSTSAASQNQRPSWSSVAITSCQLRPAAAPR